MNSDAPELAPYLDEPRQLPSGSVGKAASLRLRFDARGHRSILGFMDRRAPLLVQRALYCDEGMPGLPVVHIISNAGGILQGDRYTMEFVAGAGSCGHITTQAATKIHEMDANYASQTQDIILKDGAYLEYIPDPIIPFRHSRFLTRTRIRISPTATLLYSEILMAGRKYYGDGERFRFDLFSSRVRAERPCGSELFVEKFVIQPALSTASQLGVLGEFDVFGNVILLTPREHADAIFDRVPAVWDGNEPLAAGVSRLPNDTGLVYKVLGMESGVVRARIREFWSLVRLQVKGHSVPPKFPWR